MSIRDEARQEAERRWPDAEAWQMGVNADREWRRRAFIAGAVWASEQADRDPSDAEVNAAGEAIWVQVGRVPKEVIRAALLAAQEVRRG